MRKIGLYKIFGSTRLQMGYSLSFLIIFIIFFYFAIAFSTWIVGLVKSWAWYKHKNIVNLSFKKDIQHFYITDFLHADKES